MSGLVTGLQNRLQRFESASDLILLRKRLCKSSIYKGVFLFTYRFGADEIKSLPNKKLVRQAPIFDCRKLITSYESRYYGS